jgi:hypothetical protein
VRIKLQLFLLIVWHSACTNSPSVSTGKSDEENLCPEIPLTDSLVLGFYDGMTQAQYDSNLTGLIRNRFVTSDTFYVLWFSEPIDSIRFKIYPIFDNCYLRTISLVSRSENKLDIYGFRLIKEKFQAKYGNDFEARIKNQANFKHKGQTWEDYYAWKTPKRLISIRPHYIFNYEGPNIIEPKEGIMRSIGLFRLEIEYETLKQYRQVIKNDSLRKALEDSLAKSKEESSFKYF